MKQDPLALAIFGAALALLAGLLLYVFVFKTPEPAAPARAFGFVEPLRRQIAGLTAKLEDTLATRPAPPAAKKPAAPAVKAEPSLAVPQPPTSVGPPPGHWLQVRQPPAGITWTYRVSVEPPVWQDAVLVYRTVQQGDALVVHTEFRHAKGEMKFQLGTFQPHHPSHANTRFPGFFMHAAYLPAELWVGQKLAWELPWQLPDGGVRKGRIKRYEGEVTGWESNAAPIVNAPTVRIETVLSYIEDGQTRATARETLWYAAKAQQMVKVVREGRTPDEGSSRIVAELVEYR